jgi:hypothetical protein
MAQPNPFVPNQLFPDQSNPFAAQAPTQADAYTATSNAYQSWLARERASGVASGMLDPQTGWPTQNSLVDAARQYGGAMIAGTSGPKGLAMDAASRMARAKEMGFDTDMIWHHGTAGDHTSFSPSQYGSVTNASEPGTWFTGSYRYASEYAQNAEGIRGDPSRIIDAHIRAENPLIVHFNDSMEPVINGEVAPFESNHEIIKHALKNGHDAVYWPDGNFAEESAAATVFNPKNIRSTDAAFDPKNAESDDITH